MRNPQMAALHHLMDIKTVKNEFQFGVPNSFVQEAEIFYNDDDIRLCKKYSIVQAIGFEGIVIGLLNKMQLFIQKNKHFVELAFQWKLHFTALDRTKRFQSWKIIDCGCQRILTSGQMPCF